MYTGFIQDRGFAGFLQKKYCIKKYCIKFTLAHQMGRTKLYFFSEIKYSKEIQISFGGPPKTTEILMGPQGPHWPISGINPVYSYTTHQNIL